EARALLLSIDPLASLAETQRELQRRLIELTPTPSPDLHCAWKEALEHAAKQPPEKTVTGIPEQYLVVIECKDEKGAVGAGGAVYRRGTGVQVAAGGGGGAAAGERAAPPKTENLRPG